VATTTKPTFRRVVDGAHLAIQRTKMRAAFVGTGLTTLLLACGTTKTDGTGPLLLQAFGGPSGQVAAQIPLEETGVGLQQTSISSVTAGACQFTSYRNGGIGSPGPGGGNFGPMSASVGGTTISVPYSGTGYPTQYFPSSVTLGTGGKMTFHGDGGTTVPSFDVSATIPGLGVITSPVPATTTDTTTVIDTTQDLAVTWLPISIGEIQFSLTNTPVSGQIGVSIACTFEGATGSGVVPQTLLASFKTGYGPFYGELISELDATTTVDGLEIDIQGYQNTSSNDGGQFAVTLQ
jgi:hypothetical protein